MVSAEFLQIPSYINQYSVEHRASLISAVEMKWNEENLVIPHSPKFSIASSLRYRPTRHISTVITLISSRYFLLHIRERKTLCTELSAN